MQKNFQRYIAGRCAPRASGGCTVPKLSQDQQQRPVAAVLPLKATR